MKKLYPLLSLLFLFHWGWDLKSLFKTDENKFVLTGSTISSSDRDMILIKFDDSGSCEYEWLRQFPDHHNDERGRSVTQTNDGGFVIIGNQGNNILRLVKTDPEGQIY